MSETVIQILKYIFTFGYSYYKEKREEFLLNSLNDESLLMSNLELLGKDLQADRVLLVYMHDSGAILAPGLEKFIKISNECIVSGKISSTSMSMIPYSSRRADYSYICKIMKMLYAEHTTILVKKEDFSDHSLLKKIYEQDHTDRSIVTYMCSNERYMWYISINFGDDKIKEISEDQQMIINKYRDKILSILNKYFKIDHTF